jgi:predicted nucleic acid-binding protein
VNATEPHEVDHTASRQLLAILRARRLPVIVPTLVVVEVAGTVSRLRDAGRAARLVTLLLQLPNVRFANLDDALARQAANLAGAYRLRGADAVYGAVAQAYSTTLVTRDREQHTRLTGVVAVLHPVDALAQLQGP